MTSKLTRERIELIANFHRAMTLPPSHDEIEELARMALAAMDSEPVRNPVLAYVDSYRDMAKQGVESVPIWSVITDLERNIAPLYRHAQPAPVVPNGLRLALSNAGIAAPESDEMLAATCEKHIQALVTWVKDRKPFQSAPVVPSFEEWLSAANRKPLGWVKDAMGEAYDAFRAAMLQAGNSPAIPDGYVMVPDDLKEATADLLATLDDYPEQLVPINRDSSVVRALRAAMLAAAPQSPGSEPATVPGKWIPVSERMPEMGEKQRYVLAADFKNNYWPNIPNTQVGVYGDWFDDGNPTWDDGDGEDLHLKEVTHWMPLPAGPQGVKGE